MDITKKLWMDFDKNLKEQRKLEQKRLTAIKKWNHETLEEINQKIQEIKKSGAEIINKLSTQATLAESKI